MAKIKQENNRKAQSVIRDRQLPPNARASTLTASLRATRQESKKSQKP